MGNRFWFALQRDSELLEPLPELWEVEDTIEGLAARDSEPAPGACPRSPPIPPMYCAPLAARYRVIEPEPEPPTAFRQWYRRAAPEPAPLSAEQAAALERTPEQIAQSFAEAIAQFTR